MQGRVTLVRGDVHLRAGGIGDLIFERSTVAYPTPTADVAIRLRGAQLAGRAASIVHRAVIPDSGTRRQGETTGMREGAALLGLRVRDQLIRDHFDERSVPQPAPQGVHITDLPCRYGVLDGA